MQRAGRLLGKLKLAPDLHDPEARVRAVWVQAAGKKIAEHTRTAGIVRGTLIVEVEDMVWQRQLVPLKHFLVRNLAKALGEALVADLDFRPMPARRKPQRAATHEGGLLANVDEAAGIEDPVMRGLYRESKKRELA